VKERRGWKGVVLQKRPFPAKPVSILKDFEVKTPPATVLMKKSRKVA